MPPHPGQSPDWGAQDWIVRREVLAEGPWLGMLVRVIEDTPEHLVTFVPTGSPFGFPSGNWPTPTRTHPWSDRRAWQGHGCLMIQRPGDAYAVWHFWHGEQRSFVCWYLNLQEPFRRTAIGYDTQDLELDLIVFPGGRWQTKDNELMDQRVAEGRWTAERVARIRADGSALAARLDAGERWWPLHYRDWQPDPAWRVPDALPDGWDRLPW